MISVNDDLILQIYRNTTILIPSGTYKTNIIKTIVDKLNDKEKNILVLSGEGSFRMSTGTTLSRIIINSYPDSKILFLGDYNDERNQYVTNKFISSGKGFNNFNINTDNQFYAADIKTLSKEYKTGDIKSFFKKLISKNNQSFTNYDYVIIEKFSASDEEAINLIKQTHKNASFIIFPDIEVSDVRRQIITPVIAVPGLNSITMESINKLDQKYRDKLFDELQTSMEKLKNQRLEAMYEIEKEKEDLRNENEILKIKKGTKEDKIYEYLKGLQAMVRETNTVVKENNAIGKETNILVKQTSVDVNGIDSKLDKLMNKFSEATLDIIVLLEKNTEEMTEEITDLIRNKTDSLVDIINQLYKDNKEQEYILKQNDLKKTYPYLNIGGNALSALSSGFIIAGQNNASSIDQSGAILLLAKGLEILMNDIFNIFMINKLSKNQGFDLSINRIFKSLGFKDKDTAEWLRGRKKDNANLGQVAYFCKNFSESWYDIGREVNNILSSISAVPSREDDIIKEVINYIKKELTRQDVHDLRNGFVHKDIAEKKDLNWVVTKTNSLLIGLNSTIEYNI